MPVEMVSDADDDDGEFSGSDADNGFDEDMEALRRACILTGTDPQSIDSGPTADPNGTADSDEDDLELVRGIQQRFSACTQAEGSLFTNPLSTILPVASDEDEDDFETLRAIQRRFTGYETESLKNSTGDYLNKPEQVHATDIALKEGTSNHFVLGTSNFPKGFPDSLDAGNTFQNSESFKDDVPEPAGLIEWQQPENHDLAIIPSRGSGFPKSAQMFIDAIKKNRACQKFLRSKLGEVEARIEENKKLTQRVKILKDFQLSCKKRTGRALSQKKDARVQLISETKPGANSKLNGKKVSPLCYGPDENSHSAIYRTVLARHPMSLGREKWSSEERENLAKGIKQLLQELLLQRSVDLISDVDGAGGSSDFDGIIASIRDLDVTPESIRSFLPNVNWERLASMCVSGRSGAECESRWLNYEDPLINNNPWTKMEDKKLLHVVQERGISNWIDIAVLLGTNRTPFQCLARYQRSLNPSIMKRNWTEDDDDKLRSAIETFGESNWQLVASMLEGRTGTQCSNRWIKTLHPARQKVGRWTSDEDKRLKVAVMLFGPKTWRKIAQFVPGRTHVQCRERWFNSLDPSLNLGEWTEEEDSRLKEAIGEHGYYWSKVAACLPRRTDNQCRRRWKVLLPHEVPLLQAARKIQKAALISNFVDRESERPALGPNDFVSLGIKNSVSESENMATSGKQKRKSRSKRPAKQAQSCSNKVPSFTNGNDVELETSGGIDAISKKKRVKKPYSKNKRSSGPTQDGMKHDQEVGSFDGQTKKESSRRLKRKPGESLEGKEIDMASSDIAVPKKKVRGTQPRSRKHEGTGLNKARLSACEDSELRIMTSGEGDGGGGDASKNKKASEPGQRKKKCDKLQDDVSGMIGSEEVASPGRDDSILVKNKRLSLPHLEQDKHTYPSLDSTSLTITKGNGFEAFGSVGVRDKNVPYSRSECSRLLAELPEMSGPSDVDPKQDKHTDAIPDTSSFRVANDNEVEAFGSDGVRKKDPSKLHSRRNKYSRLLQEFSQRIDSSEAETLGVDDAILKNTGLNHSSSSKSFTITEKQVVAFDGNGAAIKKRTASEPCSSSKCTNDRPQNSGHLPLPPEGLSIRAMDADEYDMTLSSFIKNKMKKRKLNFVKKDKDASGGNCRNGRKNGVLSSQPMQSSHLEDPPPVAVDVIDSGKSNPVAGGSSSLRESLKAPSSIDLAGEVPAGDEANDACSPPCRI
ncbi:uncharacterized protein LOC127793055 [Diospyros lotus]|uniref:uncharacterized protein LOC127793055 n=1 Tax=Diospyros lotus TaxID=55363 RepID=UPI0022570F99|nr:uncharacterized protein LOC127793055 [Diospyros lotus]